MSRRWQSLTLATAVASSLLIGFESSAHATALTVPSADCAVNTTTDTSDFQNIVTTNAANGDTTVIPDNCTLELNRMLELPSNTSITGAGSASVLQFILPTTLGGGSATFSGDGDKDCATYFGWHNDSGTWKRDPALIRSLLAPGTSVAHVDLLSFHVIGCTGGSPSGPSTGPYAVQPGIQMVSVDDFSIKHVEVEKTPSIGIQYKDSTNGEISYNLVHNTGRDGITGFYTLGAPGTTAVDAAMTLAGNVVKYVGDDGMSVNVVNPNGVTANGVMPYDFTFTNNKIYGRPNPDNQQVTGTSYDRLPRGRGLVMTADGATYSGNTVNNTVADGVLVIDNVGLSDGSTQPDGISYSGTVVTRAGQATPGFVAAANRQYGFAVENAKTVTAGSTNSTTTSYQGPLYTVNCSACSISLATGSS